MEGTRRYWVAVALAGLLAFWAIVIARPPLLAGAAVCLAWLLTRQYRFANTVRETVEALHVDVDVDRPRVTTAETTLATLSVQAREPVAGTVSFAVGHPAVSTEHIECHFSRGTQQATTTGDIMWPVAGTFTFDQPAVTITDSLGLFRQATTLGPTPSVTVEPNAPSSIHVGDGGDQIAIGVGEHATDSHESGLAPAEVRKYVPGDNTRKIDWNATARFDEPHVREFEAETELATHLFVDHRTTMGTGQAGETKLDFARQVALAVVRNAEAATDPLGWYTVGDGGLTNSVSPSSANGHYRTAVDGLNGLKPTERENEHTVIRTAPAQARQLAQQLDGNTPFETALEPFFDAADIYVQRIANDPLFGAIRTISLQFDGGVRIVIVTDDENRAELREAVKIARRRDAEVLVFLTPTVLYEPHTFGDLDAAYRRYSDFEQFRTDLASLERVSAFEVGPGDRLGTVLSAGTQRRRTEQ